MTSHPHETVYDDETRTPTDHGGGAAALRRGDVVNGRYRIVSLVGSGGMGVVYQVSDLVQPERSVALKTIRSHGASASEIARFKAEFRHMARLRHPNVAEVYDFERMQGTADHFFTMQMIAGRDVYQVTEGAPWQTSLDLLVQVCRALAYIHSRRLIHFDIKPANVLVDPSGVVKVLDFGIATMRPAGALRRLRGTPAYMAPEIAATQVVDHRVDLFSLGILAYQLFCRALPYAGQSSIDILHKTHPVAFTAAQRDALPEWLRAIVLRLCALEPAARFRTANAVIEEINARGGLDYRLDTVETRESYIFSTRFIGRDAEYEQINAFIGQRTRGKGKGPPVLLVGGQSGIGKSRLAREARHHTQLARVSFIESACYEQGVGEYDAIAKILRYAVPLAGGLGGAALLKSFGPELVKVEPALAQTLGTAPSELLEGAERERQRLIVQVCEFLVRLAGLAPYVLHVNDLQWASPATVEVLVYLARRLAVGEERGERIRLAVLGSFRDDEIDGRPCAELIRTLRDEGAVEMIALRPLGRDAVRELLGSMLGVEELPPAFVDRVAYETGGNPFFAEEVMRVLVEKGSVYLSGGVWAANESVASLEIPGTVAAVFQRRISMLDANERLLLEVLAACAHPTSPALLAEVAALDMDVVHQALGQLEQRGMLERDLDGGELRYRVTHERMRETVYEHLPRSRRTALHRGIAEAMEDSEAGRRDDLAPALAHHFARAEAWAKAVQHARVAAEQAQRLGRLLQTVELLEQARAWLRELPADATTRLEVLLDEERVLETLAERERQQAVIDELLALAAAAGDRPALVKAHIRQGELLTLRERYHEGHRYLEEALALSRAFGDARGEHEALNSMAFLRWREGRHGEAVALNEQLLEMDRRSGDRAAYAKTLINLGAVLPSLGDRARWQACVEEATRLCMELGDSRSLMYALHLEGNVHRAAGELDRALACYRRCEDLANQLGLSPFPNRSVALSAIASVSVQQGKLAEGLAVYDQLIQIMRDGGLAPELAHALGTAAELLIAMERTEDALRYLREAVTIDARIGDGEGEAATWRTIAQVHEGLGRRDEAEAAWTRARALSARTDDPRGELAAVEGLARGARAVDPTRAAGHYAEAAELAHRAGDRPREGSLLNSLAILEWSAGRHAAALAHYERALAIFEELGDPANGGLVLNSIAVTLLALGRHKQARSRLDEALRVHARSGQALLRGQALAVLGDLHVALGELAPAADRYSESLTVRRTIGDRRGEGWMQLRLAEAYVELGDQRARDHAAAARDLAIELADPELAEHCRRVTLLLGM